MSIITAPNTHTSPFLQLARRLWQTSPAMIGMGIVSTLLFLLTGVMAVLDPRLITGMPAWIKPMKFAISIAFYSFTFTWILSYLDNSRRWVRLIGDITTLAFAVELVLIIMQVVRGVRSHFNLATPFDATVFSVMGSFIVLAWVMSAIAAFLLIRQQMTNNAFGWSLRLGLLVSLFGAAVAFMMTSPTPAQLEIIASGAAPLEVGAHSVGVADGGAGLAFLGWSTEGGDYRIPHFIGLHALQAIPLLGWLINTRLPAWTERRRTMLVWLAGLGYFGYTLLFTWQAARGQSIINPDVLTWLVAIGLGMALSLGTIWAIRSNRLA